MLQLKGNYEAHLYVKDLPSLAEIVNLLDQNTNLSFGSRLILYRICKSNNFNDL